MDGRNIRASYGTSKYCSAFIKNVRCNNPECTYLHTMGDIEDTFTKQEIQAGYVTSGRDVLARQQQIVQQALSASAAGGVAPRKRVGGGGPSGTGRAASNPVFPVPTFDEPARTTPTLVPPPPAAASVGRAITTGTGFPTISAANAAAAAPSATSSIGRSSSTGIIPNPSHTAVSNILVPPGGSKSTVAAAGAASSSAKPVAKGTINGGGPGINGTLPPPGATAASVVAGVHSINGSNEPPAPHTTLTPLTPLKRSSTKGGTKSSSSSIASSGGDSIGDTKLTSLRTGGKAKSSTSSNRAPGSPSSTSGKSASVADPNALIGGAVIAAPAVPTPVGSGSLNGLPLGGNTVGGGAGPGLGALGGDVFTGTLNSKPIGGGAPIGGGNAKDKWNSNGAGGLGGDPVYPAGNSGGLWSNGSSAGGQQGLGAPGGGGGSQIGGGVIGGGNGFAGSGNGSSALASMLGINLPTGSGSLSENSTLWNPPASSQRGPAPIASLNGSSVPIGPGPSTAPNGLIGGVAIGGGGPPAPPGNVGVGAIGGGNGNKSDMALLQSLLPGVHITSGNNQGNNGFGSIGGTPPGQQHPGNNNGFGGPQGAQWGNNGLQGGTAPIGAGAGKQGNRQAPGSIW